MRNFYDEIAIIKHQIKISATAWPFFTFRAASIVADGDPSATDGFECVERAQADPAALRKGLFGRGYVPIARRKLKSIELWQQATPFFEPIQRKGDDDGFGKGSFRALFESTG